MGGTTSQSSRPRRRPKGQSLTRDDYLVICGDFGAVCDWLTDDLQYADDQLDKERLCMWYAGHHHVDRLVADERHCVLYQQIVRLGEASDFAAEVGALADAASQQAAGATILVQG